MAQQPSDKYLARVDGCDKERGESPRNRQVATKQERETPNERRKHMKAIHQIIALGLSVVVAGAFAGNVRANSVRETVGTATELLAKKQGSTEPIPAAALQKAKGVAIFSLTKAGLVVGGTGGDGVVMIRSKPKMLPMTSWCAPIPMGFSGGSFGAQIGVSAIHLIVLLNSDTAVRVFTRPGKLDWNATASGTAGKTSGTEHEGGLLSDQDVTVYKETSGLYGGATIGGAELNIQDDRIQSAYGSESSVRDILDGKAKAPDYAARLYQLLDGKH